MPNPPCHPPVHAADARDLLVRVLTIPKVAAWCGVSESAVSQWLHRGNQDAPIPVKHVPSIAEGATRSGMDFDLGLIWPSMRGRKASFLCLGGEAVR